MNVLLAGGAGYIGSHTCVALIESGHNVIIADNFSNSKIDTIYQIEEISEKKISFYEIDVTDNSSVDHIFSSHEFDAVIHFAGYKSVSESRREPLKYYYNNLVSTVILSKACLKYDVKRFVFSSSAAVYGENTAPFVETMELLTAANPYAETKTISEKILSDALMGFPTWSVVCLRYFNPVGAHESGKIGESPSGIPDNLMPYLTRVAIGKLDKLKVFGTDYPTIDGTGVRDYIHVMDLAEGHVAAVERMSEGVRVYNLGTGQGTSVFQLIRAFEEANNIEIPYEIVERRSGDVADSYADVSRAERELGWKAKRSMSDMCRDAWKFEKTVNRVDFI